MSECKVEVVEEYRVCKYMYSYVYTKYINKYTSLKIIK